MASLLFSSSLFAAKVEPSHEKIEHKEGLSKADIYPLGVTVATSPYIGIRSEFDASDVIVNLSTMNEDLRILQERQKLTKRLTCDELPWSKRPLLELSGDVVGNAFYRESYNDNSSHDINLAGVRLDTLASVSEWAYGLISLEFDNGPLDSVIRGNGRRISNSKIFLSRGFLTIGNLDKSPVYFSIGQMFVPFGRYSSGVLTSIPTAQIAKTNARAAVLGAFYNGIFGQAYAFRGDSDVASTGINQWGLNAGYEGAYNDITYEVGAGYIANMADATGMQNTGTRVGFPGFAKSRYTEMLEHRVPGVDIYGRGSYKCFSMNVEYISATKSFDEVDLSYNDGGAQPSAFYIDGTYRFKALERPFGFTLGYGHSWESLGLNVPEQSFYAALTGSIWKNTIEGLEYRHDENYSSSDTSGGSGFGPVSSVGGSRNSIVGQVGVYF